LVWTDDEIIKSIREGRDDGIVYLYSTYRKEFCQWAVKHYPADHDIAQDAFQETMLAFRFNLVHNRIGEMKSTLKTYLFAIGKNQLINRLKKRHHEISSDDLTLLQHQQSMVKRDPEELTERQERIKKLIKNMEEPCHSILKMFYYLGYSMDVIAQRMDYKNEDVAKSQKARCIKKIREALTASR
jgi:RNA polymerase sigma factor (sigma-70 family)